MLGYENTFLYLRSTERTSASPNDFGPVTIDSHGHNGASLARREGQLSKFRLLDADLIIAVQPAPTEVLAPVGILVVDHQQSEASVLAVGLASSRARYRRAQNRSTLRVILTVRRCLAVLRRNKRVKAEDASTMIKF